MDIRLLMLTAFRLLLGTIFLVSSISKAVKPRHFADTIAAFRVIPHGWVHTIALILVGAEFVVAVLLLIGWQSRAAAILGGLLIILFTIVIIISLLRGHSTLGCGCFGTWHAQKLSMRLVGRNLALWAMSFCITLWGGGPLTLDDYWLRLQDVLAETFLPFALLCIGLVILILLSNHLYRLLLLTPIEE